MRISIGVSGVIAQDGLDVCIARNQPHAVFRQVVNRGFFSCDLQRWVRILQKFATERVIERTFHFACHRHTPRKLLAQGLTIAMWSRKRDRETAYELSHTPHSW